MSEYAIVINLATLLYSLSNKTLYRTSVATELHKLERES